MFITKSLTFLYFFISLLGFETGFSTQNAGCRNTTIDVPGGMELICSLRCSDRDYRVEPGRYRSFDINDDWPGDFSRARCRDRRPPQFTFCPPITQTIYADPGKTTAEVIWAPVTAVDNSGEDPVISCTEEPGVKHVGERTVHCKARDSNDNVAACSFRYIVKAQNCIPLEEPENGVLSCDEWAYGIFCSLHCDRDYDIPPGSTTPTFFVCGSSSEWSPTSKVPNCMRPVETRRVHLPVELYVITENCPDGKNEMQTIETSFMNLIDSIELFDICDRWERCRIKDFNVLCEKTSETPDVIEPIVNDIALQARRRRELNKRSTNLEKNVDESVELQHLLTIASHHESKRLTKRATSGGIHQRNRRMSGPWYELIVEFNIHITKQESRVADDNYLTHSYNAMRKLYDLAQKLEHAIGNGSAVFEVNGEELQFSEEPMFYDYTTPTCGRGFFPSWKTHKCIGCPSGQFYDESTVDCELCPQGSYQPKEAQIKCILCPPGTTTITTGVTSLNHCR